MKKLQQGIYKTMAEMLLNLEIKLENAKKGQDEVPKYKYIGIS